MRQQCDMRIGSEPQCICLTQLRISLPLPPPEHKPKHYLPPTPGPTLQPTWSTAVGRGVMRNSHLPIPDPTLQPIWSTVMGCGMIRYTPPPPPPHGPTLQPTWSTVVGRGVMRNSSRSAMTTTESSACSASIPWLKTMTCEGRAGKGGWMRTQWSHNGDTMVTQWRGMRE